MHGLVNEHEKTAVIIGDVRDDAKLYHDVSDSWEHHSEVHVTIDGAEYSARVAAMNKRSHVDRGHTCWNAHLFDLRRAGMQ